MRVLRSREDAGELTDPYLRNLVEQRIDQVEETSPWDADELGPIVVVEPGDTADDLDAALGFPVLRGLFDDVPFGDEGYAPAFEFIEAHGEACYELVFIISDSGFGYDIFVLNRPGVDPVLLAMCATYTQPA